MQVASEECSIKTLLKKRKEQRLGTKAWVLDNTLDKLRKSLIKQYSRHGSDFPAPKVYSKGVKL